MLHLLSDSLEKTHFKSFSLRRNNLGWDGIKVALEYLQNDPILEEFYLDHNTISHTRDADELCEIIRDHQSIESLQRDGCVEDDMDGNDILCSIMTAGMWKLKKIEMSSNGIRTGGSTFISHFLATNPVLETLLLCDNELNNDDAASIAQMCYL